MPDDKFEFPKYQTRTYDKESMEASMTVKLTPSEKLSDFLTIIQRGSRELFIRFIVSPDLELFMGSTVHADLERDTKIQRKDCLIEDGSFWVDPATRKINFRYTSGDHAARVAYARQVAENKIKEFLTKHGIDTSGIITKDIPQMPLERDKTGD